jgi:hypothetical protein
MHQVRRHLERCAACRRAVARFGQADQWLRDLPAVEPSAGFDAAFWRQVAALEETRGPSWRRWPWLRWRPLLAAGLSAALLAGVWFYGRPEPPWTPEERFMAQNMELLNDYELIRDLELLEDWEAIQAMKEPS